MGWAQGWIVRRIESPLGDGAISGGCYKRRELAVCYGQTVNTEAIDFDLVCGGFLGIVTVRSHTEGSAGYSDHIGVVGSNDCVLNPFQCTPSCR